MKCLIVLAALLFPVAYATAPIGLNDVACTAAGVCVNPAPQVQYLSLRSDSVFASVNGIVYDSGHQLSIDVAPVFAVNATPYAPDGSQLTLSAAFKHWTTRTVSGRGQMYVQHYELLGGTLQ